MMVQAFKVILAGGIFIPYDLRAGTGESSSAGRFDAKPEPSTMALLTKRQTDVLRLIKSGRSNKEIASELGISENTVKVHTNSLYKVLQVHNRVGASSMYANERTGSERRR